jgi:predicted permease
MLKLTVSIASVVLPILLMLSIGYVGRVKKYISQEVINGIKGLITNVMLPALSIGVFYKTQFTKASMIIFPIMFACWVMGFLFGFLIKNALRLGKDSLLPYFTTTAETGMFGYGLYAMLFTRELLYNLALVDLGMALFVFGIYFFSLYKRRGFSTIACLKSYCKMPMLISLIVGILFNVTGLGRLISATEFGFLLDSIVSFFTAPISFLILLVVGYGLEFSIASIKRALSTVVIRMFVLSGLCVLALFVITRFVNINDYTLYAIVLLFSLPPVFLLPVFTNNVEENNYTSTVISFYTVVSIFAFVLIAVSAISRDVALIG